MVSESDTGSWFSKLKETEILAFKVANKLSLKFQDLKKIELISF